MKKLLNHFFNEVDKKIMMAELVVKMLGKFSEEND